MDPYLANPPQNEQLVEQWRADAKQAQAERERRRVEARPARRRAVEALGPKLADCDAAADCCCSCHPRPEDAGLHDGGVTCPCQPLSEQVRRNVQLRQRAALAALAELWPQIDGEREQERQREAQQLAQRLGFTITSIGGVAPFMVEGDVDGCRFYLRSRHEQFRLVYAPTPGTDPWQAQDAVVIDDGDDDRLGDYHRGSYRTVVEHVSVVLHRHRIAASCAHTKQNGPFCSRCGTPLQPPFVANDHATDGT